MNATKALSIGNFLGLVLVLTLNALANALPINGMNTGQISDLYPSLFTPAGFTFSIWGIIYLLLIIFGVAQFFIKDQHYYKELSLWFMLSCIANASWIFSVNRNLCTELTQLSPRLGNNNTLVFNDLAPHRVLRHIGAGEPHWFELMRYEQRGLVGIVRTVWPGGCSTIGLDRFRVNHPVLAPLDQHHETVAVLDR